eukprot:scaffold93322_cov64-Phaeocystis_antarctica.AAC.3
MQLTIYVDADTDIERREIDANTLYNAQQNFRWRLSAQSFGRGPALRGAGFSLVSTGRSM